MKALQNCYLGRAFNPEDINGTARDGVALDLATLRGSSNVMFIYLIGNIAANMTALKIQESSDNVTYTDLTGATFTNPTAAGSDNTIGVCFIAGPTKRYLRATATGGAGATLVAGLWVVENTGEAPNSATERGVAQQLFA